MCWPVETDAYVTASTDVSSYYTAAESDADSNLRSAEALPAEKRQTGVEENLAEPQVLKPQFSKPLKTNVVAASKFKDTKAMCYSSICWSILIKYSVSFFKLVVVECILQIN